MCHLQHYADHEHDFVSQVEEWLDIVVRDYRPWLSYFLNPRQQTIVRQLVASYPDCQVSFWGGYRGAENQRALIAPSYYPAQTADFEISAFEILYGAKFNQLSHRQILGTLLGQGIDRNRLGDIISDGQAWQFFVDQAIGDFLNISVERIGSTKVTLKALTDADEILHLQENWQMRELVVSSLRLDLVIGEALKLSRQKSKQLVEGGQCKVNWRQVDQASYSLAQGDIISVRSFGRLRFDGILKETKKDKYRISIAVLKSNS
ncbi:hypothetical protein AWM75_06585 [Aerococcus urinaehominis]|uniref:Uncharacterized protein n=1 Tax=Aerococcus urinaehominis TaxID=128944 RepID=A0A0X8FN13_9LACT|nr:YlmH/Sll1252 family protein [Aerococcus urinaehominis]AMB99667.1 hypothetical protein AWM75_06585 [Aerococcus urinaehominis]SDL89611.1 RNA-binding protein YlmH, contains S4-like domain [Aerococcus urinaehominis]